MDRKS